MLKNKKIVLGIIVAAFSFLFVNNNAMAIDSASINAKAAFEGVRNCFNSNAYNASFKASELSSNFASGIGPNVVKLPYNLGHNVSNNSMNCKDVMLGNGGRGGLNGGLLPDNIQNSSNANTVAKYFAGNNLNGNGGLGYTATADGGNIEGTGQSLTYNVTSSASECAGNAPVLMMTGTGTISVGGGSATTAIVFPTIAKSGNSITVNQDRTYNVPAPGSGVSYMFESSCAGAKIKIADVGSSSSPKYQVYVTDYNETASLDEYVSRFVIGTKVTNNGAEYTNTKAFSATSVTGKISLSASTEPVIVAGNSNNFSNDYTLTRSGGAYTALLRGLNGSGNRMGYNVAQVYAGYNYLALSRQEVYDLYKYYANNVLRLSITCKGDSNYAMYEGSGIPINWKGGDSACRVYNTGNVSIPANLYGVDSNRHFTATISSVQDIATALNNLGDLCSPKLDGVEGCGGNDPTPSPGSPAYSASTDGMSCDDINVTDGKIGAMQWILCPTMDNTRYTASWIDEHIRDWLETDTSLYNNSAVTQVWGAIRNIANVAMVALLLVVILSQLTGRGIDNYGIKKMLPRLIIMAIIVNLSLYICQIAADLSNIIGVGLQNMFGSIGNSISTNTSGSSFLGGMMVGLFASASGASAGTGAALTAISLGAPIAVALIIVVIVVFLVIIVALVTFSLMLGARQIIIIVCIVLAPLAFAMYILPNTQNLFKKWWDLFKAALIIFPICGAMGGISYLLRAMAQGNQISLGVGGHLIMMVLPYLVFFLLPTLLKNAIGALGKVGGALTSLGNTIRNGGRQLGQTGMRAAQNTQRYKDLQKEAARRQEQQRVNRVMQRFGNGSDIEQRLQDARNRMNNAQEGTREYNAAQRDLRRAQTDQRQFYEAQQAHYRMEAEQQVAGTSPDILEARAQSAQEALEAKNITDQFANASTDQIRTALVNYQADYSSDRSSSNANRLRTMQNIAINKGLNFDVLKGLNSLNLNDKDENDQKVLNSVNYSSLYNGLTRGELGAELDNAVNAYDNDRSVSNMNRLQNIIKTVDTRGMDKEMLTGKLGKLELQAANANDARVLDTLGGVNNKIVKQYGAQMSKDNNKQQKMSMDTFADSTGSVKLSEALAGKGVEYLNGTNDDILEYVAKHSMTNGVYNPVLSSDALASIVANTTDEKVLRKAREMYNNMNPDDIRFTGDQLAKYDIETLRQVANRVTPNSQLQRNFVAATNTIANSSELMSRLSPDSRAVFKSIRRGAGINDNLFD